MNRLFANFAVFAAAGFATIANAQQLATQVITSGLTRPCWVGSPDGDNARLFVIEQRLNRASGTDPFTGRIRWINLANNTVSSTTPPYLTISDVAHVDGMNVGEQGVLGLAFHPNFMTNGYFYIHRTRGSDGAIVIERYRANAPYATSTTADPASLQTVLVVPHPSNRNHNGGWIEFGPDGNLYFSIGDGGAGNDPGPGIGNAQTLTNLLGKISRIDVDGADNIPGNADDADGATPYRIPAGNPFSGAGQRREIWAYGLRNPWRNSFDRQTGDLWIADVGQDFREELNVSIGNPAGRNYGWKCVEGFRCTSLSSCPTCPTTPAGITAPILDYGNTGTAAVPPLTNVAPGFTGIAITGGFAYRGCDIPWFQGHYIFTDYGNATLFTLTYSSGGGIQNLTNRTTELDPAGTPAINNVVSFGEDASGEVYIVDATGGEVFKIVPATPIPDCNPVCGTSDFNGDGDFGTDADIEAFFACLAGNCCPTCFPGGADFNGDGDTGTDADIESFFRVLGGGNC